VPASFRGARSAGEDVATMIGTALDHAGPLRWVDGWRVMGEAQRADPRTLTPDEARAIARAQRSRYFVTGRLVPRGDSVEVVVELNDAASDTATVVERATAVATTADAWRGGLRAFNRLLPELIPGSAADLSAEWETREPAAVARFLLGEAAFRRVHLVDALAQYEAAVATDSSFALAAVRGAQAATWNHRPREAVSLIRLALAHPTTPRYRHFALGYRAYLEGRPDSASAEFHRALRIDPEMAAAWMQLGETYTHLLPVAGQPDSLADDAFAHARLLDPSATHLLLHPIERRLRRGLVAEAAPMIRQFLAADPDTTLAQQVRLMEACVRRGPAAVDWAQAVAARPFAVLAAAQNLAAAGAQLPCAAAAYDAVRTFETPAMAAESPEVDARRWSALVGLQGVLLAQGHDSVAATLVDSAVARGEGGRSLFLVHAPLAPAYAARAADAARHYASRWGAACAQCTDTESAWQLGVWWAQIGDAATAAAVAARAAARARGGGGTLGDTIMARSAAAWAALARRDSSAARAGFAALLAEPVPSGGELIWTLWAPRGGERLAYARLLADRREFRRAVDVADVFDSPTAQSAVAYLRASLQLRAAAADSLRDARAAERYRARLASLAPVPTLARRE
jgi:tetratricopeptide (TPR) repeat protein